jgi:hypothetical protein
LDAGAFQERIMDAQMLRFKFWDKTKKSCLLLRATTAKRAFFALALDAAIVLLLNMTSSII